MSLKIPLLGLRIHLSGSIPDEATKQQIGEIGSFVERFAQRVLSEGGTLVHGSHPTLIDPLKRAAIKFVSAAGAKEQMTLVRSANYASTQQQLAEVDEQRTYASVHIIPKGTGDKDVGLISMREWMAERSDVVVAVGGKWYGTHTQRSGIPAELEETLKRGKPAFLVGGFGGAAEGYLKDNPGVFARLRNGLSEDANRLLSTSKNIDELVALIVGQLIRLPLLRESVPGGRMFRILALDGGGLRGAFTAAVLAKWDRMLGSNEPDYLVRHFDLVAGTSTGAILAIGLGLGLPPSRILDFYKTKGPHIFPKNRKLRHWLKSKHDSDTLRAMLEEVFQKRMLTPDSCCRLVIPTVRADHGEAEVITTAHCADRPGFRDMSAVEAALASSAAPTYFDEAVVNTQISTQLYLDGGIWANNPILPAIAESVRYLDVPLDRIDVLSVGTLGNEADFASSLGHGMAGWAMHSADLFFAAQERAASDLADSLLTRARHLRVNQQTRSEIKLDDVEAIQEMAIRGENVAKDSFVSVRSRFLDGHHAIDWRSSL